MGELIDGEWRDAARDAKPTDGEFRRRTSCFRNWITADGAPGPTGAGGFAAASGRYHLYVSLACPWAHRTLIFRQLKGLVDHISVDIVDPDMLDEGWTLKGDYPGATGDRLSGATRLHQIYTASDPAATTRVTVPVLWDKQTNAIVSNESAEIVRMFNSAFDGITGNDLDFHPADLRAEIEAINERVYASLNNGVYRCGFATTQKAYDEAVSQLFNTMDWLEALLGRRRYLAGDRLTEADWRLFPTLVRFDPVYVGHFKCDRRRLIDYPNLWAYARELYQHPGVSDTVNFDHIRRHYYFSHETINPHRIISAGPVADWSASHRRDAMRAA